MNMAGVSPGEAPKSRSLLLRRPVLRLLLMALLAEMGYAMLNISTMPVYLRNDRNFGTGVIGLVLVAFLLSEAIFKSPMGAIADRFGRKRLIILGPSLSVLTALLTVLVPHHAGAAETMCFLVLRVLDGLGAAMLWPAAFALMGDMVEDSERQQAMSLLNTCYLAGVGLALPFGGWANDLVGPYLPEVFRHSPGLFLSAVLFAAVAASGFRAAPEESRAHKALEGHGEGGFAGLLDSLKQMPEFMLLAVVTFAGIGFPMAIIKIFALEQFQMSESQFGTLVLPAVGSMALLSVPMAKLGERIGKARAVHVGMFLCFLGLAVVYASIIFVDPWNKWVFALGGLPVGFGFLLAIPAWMASVSDINPKRRAASLGAVMTAQGFGAIIGAPIGAWLYETLQPVGAKTVFGEALGRYSPFAGCAALVFLGWLLSLRILHDKPITPQTKTDEPGDVPGEASEHGIEAPSESNEVGALSEPDGGPESSGSDAHEPEQGVSER
ncbi:MAG: MFS transporter [Armatimonadetes bacterium]|nr:MFS transporter [Armatimonadota bacterium]